MALQSVYERHLPRDSIRLLTVVSNGVDFHCVLEEYQLDHLPYFAALSWCWTSGRRDSVVSITCNGQQLPVSRHLHDLLRRITPEGVPSSVRVWIDAICINQSHGEEKNFHIPRMSEVYGRAHSVIVWLGEAGAGSHLAMDPRAVATLSTQLAAFPDYAPDELLRRGLPASTDAVWQAIGRLCERDWFYRTWIVQEVALARNIEVLCGRQWLGWSSLVGLVQGVVRTGLSSLCRDLEDPASSRPSGFAVLLDLVSVRFMHQRSHCPLDYLLHMIRFKEASKPIDKVYGLLGLLSKDLKAAIDVDYAENESRYWKVYQEVAKYIIASDDKSFWLLSMASSVDRPLELPTWCPNLNSALPESLDFNNQNWHAGISLGIQHGPGIAIIPHSPNIKVSGFVIDEVQDLVQLGSPTSAPYGQSELHPNRLLAEFMDRNTRSLLLSQKAYGNPTGAIDAHSRTLIANAWADGSPVLPLQQDRVIEAYNDSIAYLSPGGGNQPPTRKTSGLDHRQEVMHQYLRQLGWWGNRPFFATRNRRVGRGPSKLRIRDLVCVFYSAGPMFILRSIDGQSYELVGDAYLHGCMDLQALPSQYRSPDREFVIG